MDTEELKRTPLYQAHIDLGRCPFDGESSLDGILAPSEMHAHHGHETAHV